MTSSAARPARRSRPRECIGTFCCTLMAQLALRLFQADAFTAVPYAGNPAAVVLLPFGKVSGMRRGAGHVVASALNFSRSRAHAIKK